MRGLRPALAIVLAVAATQAGAKRPEQPGFAEPGDIIAAEGVFDHVNAAKGIAAAIRATAAPDAQIFAPKLMRVAAYASTADTPSPGPWHTSHLWMSCDGSIGVTQGSWQKLSAMGWRITVWKRQKDGGYKWVLEQAGPLTAAPAATDMIAASVADCPARRARAGAGAAPALPDHGKSPVTDYTSGHSDDATLDWTTTITADGTRGFALRIKQDGPLREVFRATVAPPGG